MQAHYPMAAAAAGGAPTSRPRSGKLLDFSLVGPVGLLPVLEKYDASTAPTHVIILMRLTRPLAQGTIGC
jgi:hypothetical protein